MDGSGSSRQIEAVGRMRGGFPTFQAPFSPAANLKDRICPKK